MAGSGASGGIGGAAGASVDASTDASDDALADAPLETGTPDAAPDACVPVTTGATGVAHWEANGDYLDSFGTHHGSVVGTVTFVADRGAGQAFHFNGASHVEIAYDATFDLPVYSVAGWVRIAAGTNQWTTVITKEKSTGADPWNDRNFGLFVTRDDSCGGVGHPLTLQTGTIACATTVIQDGAWHHIAGTFDGCTLKTYVDGVVEASVSGAVPPTGPSQDRIWIGAWSQATIGDVDDVRVYSGALTPAEVAAIAAP
jgi:arabinan endo-1,5-alpha-L-arabinosidase